MDEEGVLDFLTSLEAMDLPDRIEEVNAKILLKIIEDTDFVAVLFCEYKLFFVLKTLSLSISRSTTLIIIIYDFIYTYWWNILKQLQFLALKAISLNWIKEQIQLSSLVTKIHTT